jgi:hypothetical protein
VREGRLRELWAAQLLPRPDKVPVALCPYCMTNHLVTRYGEEVRTTYWGNRLKRYGGEGVAAMKAWPRCAGSNRFGGPCGSARQQGSLYCFTHNNPGHWSRNPKRLGTPCRKKGCTNAAVPPYPVCMYHGARGAIAAKAKREREALGKGVYSPPGKRKAKIAAHRQRKANGFRPVEETWEHAEKRFERDRRVERRNAPQDLGSQREYSPPSRRLKPLYPV